MEKVISEVCYRTELASWLELARRPDLAQRPDLAVILDGKVKTKMGYGQELA